MLISLVLLTSCGPPKLPDVDKKLNMKCYLVYNDGFGMSRCENNEAICYVRHSFHSGPSCFLKKDIK